MKQIDYSKKTKQFITIDNKFISTEGIAGRCVL